MSVKSPESLLLYLPEEQERAIAELFDDLVRRGLPRQNQRPHITITFAQSMAPRQWNWPLNYFRRYCQQHFNGWEP